MDGFGRGVGWCWSRVGDHSIIDGALARLGTIEGRPGKLYLHRLRNGTDAMEYSRSPDSCLNDRTAPRRWSSIAGERRE